MQIIICKECEKVIEYNEDEKVTTVYAVSKKCGCKCQNQEEQSK